MNSFILLSKNKNEQQEYLNNFIKAHRISSFDVTRISPESLSASGRSSIGIEVVRNLQKTISLKPYKGEEKIIIITHAGALTTEAQNALLKILEEPPLFVYIFLCAQKDETFLPTVISRCKVIALQEEVTGVENLEDNLEIQLVTLLQGEIGERLALAETLAQDKENLPVWFESMTKFIRKRMLEETTDASIFVPLLRMLQDGYKTLTTTNVSPRSMLEHMFLTIT